MSAVLCAAVVNSTPGGNTTSAVEHTCALLLAVSRWDHTKAIFD